jgi:MATE family multidrug resistance protein
MTIESPIAHSRAPLAPTLLRLAGPVAIARLGVMGMGIVDTVVVGQIAPHELAFLALGWAPTGVVLVTGMGLLTGVQVLGARALGERNPRAAGAVWRKGMVIAAVTGAAFAALLWAFADSGLRVFGIAPELTIGAAAVTRVLALSLPFHFLHLACSSFLEAVKRPLAGTIVIWLANALNLALNLVFVPAHGASGAAMSTIVSRAFMFAALLAWIWISAAGRDHGARDKGGAGATYGALFTVGAASAVSQMAEAGAFNAMSVIAARIGPDAVATYQILLNILAVVFMIALGFSAATAVLVSEAYGAGDVKRAGRAGWTGLALNSIGMALAGMLLLLLAAPIAHGFTSDEALALLVAALVPMCALIVTPDGGQVVMAQALRGRGDNWLPTASHVFSYVALMPPLAFVLGERMGMGVSGLMAAIAVSSFVSVSILCLRFGVLARQTPSTQPSSRSTA